MTTTMAEKDAARILAASEQTTEASYTRRDLILYALGIGVSDLQFLHEDHVTFAAFPTFPCVLNLKGTEQDVVPFPPPALTAVLQALPNANPAMLLHGEQSLEVVRALNPAGAKLTCKSKIISLLDKGKGALMEMETVISDADGVVARLVSGSFLRGLTGFQSFGLHRAPRIRMPQRDPDWQDIAHTTPAQSQLYRLSGDYNPLHIDPKTAQRAGFPEPILHGLCTFGITARVLFQRFCHNEVPRFQSIRARFTAPTFPGETLEVQMWLQGHAVLFRTIAQERHQVVLDGGEFVFATTARVMPVFVAARL